MCVCVVCICVVLICLCVQVWTVTELSFLSPSTCFLNMERFVTSVLDPASVTLRGGDCSHMWQQVISKMLLFIVLYLPVNFFYVHCNIVTLFLAGFYTICTALLRYTCGHMSGVPG